MYFDTITGIEIRNHQVWFTAPGGRMGAHDLQVSWEGEGFSEILREKGREALYAKIGEENWNHEFTLEPGNTLCNYFMKASNHR